jgi:hypothetical protein
MKCHYCQRPYRDIYIQEDELIPVCKSHRDDHIQSDIIARRNHAKRLKNKNKGFESQ